MDHPVEENPRRLWVITYSNWLYRFRWLVIIVAISSIAFAAYGMRYLQVNPNSWAFFDKNSEDIHILENVENTYARSSSVLIAVAPESGDVFTPEMLRIIGEISDEAWRFPTAIRVDSLTNYKHTEADGDDFKVAELVPDPEHVTESEAARIRNIALAQPELVQQLLSKNADVTAVLVTVVRPNTEQDRKSIKKIAEAARDLKQRFMEKYPQIEIHLTGAVMADYALAQAAFRDSGSLIPLIIVLTVGALWIGLRSFYSMVATMIVVVGSALAAAGWSGWQGMVLNPITAAAPVMCMTLAIADCVHVLSGAGQLQHRGLEFRAALSESLRINWIPVLMTSVTTAIGFLTLNFADSPPLVDVGNVVSVGVMIAWVLSVTLLPALLVVLPKPKTLPLLSDPEILVRAAAKIVKYRIAILVCAAVLVAVLAAGIDRMKLDDDFIKYFSKDFEFRVDSDFVQQRLTGMHHLYYSVSSGREGAVAEPEFLAKLDSFAEWFRSQPKVTYVSVITDVIKRVNESMNGGDPAAYRLPETRELAAQELLLYEMSLPAGFDLNNQVDIARSSTLVVVRVANVTSEEIRHIAAAGEEWLAEQGLAAPATGLSVLYAHLTARNIRSMIIGSIVELIVISFLMIFLLRSLRVGLISLVPNLIPSILAFGLWGWLGTQVNLAISVVAAMTFGIVVDDTIHTLYKYQRYRRRLGMDKLTAVNSTYVSAGAPMVLIGVTLILGFGVLGLSGFAVSYLLGVLSAAVIGLAVITDLVVLPPLLLVFDRDPKPKPTPAQAQAEADRVVAG
jgi:uncharacterized protein